MPLLKFETSTIVVLLDEPFDGLQLDIFFIKQHKRRNLNCSFQIMDCPLSMLAVQDLDLQCVEGSTAVNPSI